MPWVQQGTGQVESSDQRKGKGRKIGIFQRMMLVSGVARMVTGQLNAGSQVKILPHRNRIICKNLGPPSSITNRQEENSPVEDEGDSKAIVVPLLIQRE
jgi:hypothetical protein